MTIIIGFLIGYLVRGILFRIRTKKAFGKIEDVNKSLVQAIEQSRKMRERFTEDK